MKITDNIYALDGTAGSYAYIILGEEVILIDTGRPDQRKRLLADLEVLKVRTEDIRHILLTHHDMDHIGNAGYLQRQSGCQVWVSKEDYPYVTGQEKRHGFKRFLSMLIRTEIPANLQVYPPEGKLGEFEVLPAPGHTPGHVCFRYKDILFAGDLLQLKKGEIHPLSDFWNWNSRLLKESYEILRKEDFSLICPAHGQTPLKRSEYAGF